MTAEPVRYPRAMVWLIAGAAAVLPVQAASETKQQPDASPLLVRIDKAHCLALYDVVELRLKGKGDDVASTTTRNGLKDFFVTRPGVVDCTGQREIPWRDGKDREFILSVLKETDGAIKTNVDMSKDYGLAPAPSPVRPIQQNR